MARMISDPAVLNDLVDRLGRLTPDTPRRWGTLSPGEMLAHLGDAGDGVLGLRVTPGPPVSGRPNRILKWVALRGPIRWPKGVETRPGVNPRKDGSRPGEFEADRARVVAGLRRLAVAPAGELAVSHFMFGPMRRDDWMRWAARHVDHHLRQFGL